jgi:hypothetical protein
MPTSRWERWFGASRKDLRHRLKLSNQTRDEQAARAIRAEKAVAALRSELYEMLPEPDQIETCEKIRLHSQSEAWAWATMIAMRTNVDVRIYKVYRCDRCPKHPLIGAYWHVAHQNSGWKRVAEAAKRARKEHLDRLAAEAEQGYDLDQLHPREEPPQES